MYEPNVVQGCDSMVGSIAIIAIIVTAFTTMLGLKKPADTARYCGVIVGIALVLILIVFVFVGLWSSMSLWQKAVVAVVGACMGRVWWQRRQPRKKKEEE
jgi:protein-S-isoprenylcysteine O-methyltransferase Ste14